MLINLHAASHGTIFVRHGPSVNSHITLAEVSARMAPTLHEHCGRNAPFGGCLLYTSDRNDGEAMREALSTRRFDAVFDNVYDWERGTTPDQVEATVRACGDRISRYIFLSSVAAYGDGLNHKESDPLAPDYHAVAYVRHKATTERLLFRMHARKGLPLVTFRPPFVYGPGNPFYREQFFWDRLRAGRPIIIPGDGHRLMQFVYLNAVSYTHLRRLRSRCGGCPAHRCLRRLPLLHQTPRPLDTFRQPDLVHRLQKVVQRLHPKRFHRVLVVGRYEYDLRQIHAIFP